MDEALLTFLFTDIEGSTRLWEDHPSAMREAIATHDAIVAGAVRMHSGRVFKTVGDASCSAFELPADALRAASEIQTTLQTETWPPEIEHIRVRAGVHTGTAIVGSGDYFGQPLNRVARLMSAAHGGQILVSRATATLVMSSLDGGLQLKRLGTYRLKDLNEPEEVYQVVGAGLESEFPAPATPDDAAGNLPAQLTSFVGRGAELGTLTSLLQTQRLVTVTGPGGIGKTRLSLQTAAQVAGDFPDGCWFAGLAEISSGSFVPDTVASALGVDVRAFKTAQEAVVAHLRRKRALIVLDNSEQILLAVAQFCRVILDACPSISLLVTSREPTHLKGERIVRLGPLEAEQAVELFSERANSAGAALGAAEAGDIRAICERLDHIPLAVELAASRLDAMSVRELDRRLEANIEILKSRDPSESERHKTLNAAITWSYRLLGPHLQETFAATSVFEGTFSFEAFESVCCRNLGPDGDTPFDLLQCLIDKSFVTPVPGESSTRYRLLDPIRSFGSTASPITEREEALERHFTWYEGFARDWNTTDVAAMSAELPNVRAALRYGLTQHKKERALALLQIVGQFWNLRQMPAEALHWYGLAIADIDCAPLLASQVFRRATTFATLVDDYPRAERYATCALDFATLSSNAQALAEAKHVMAVIEQRRGHLDAALSFYSEALAYFQEVGHERGIFTTLNNQAMILGAQGKYADAEVLFEKSAQVCEKTRNDDALGSILNNHGRVLLDEGRVDEAAVLFEKALALKRRSASSVDIASILLHVGSSAFAAGDLPKALKFTYESLIESQSAHSPSDVSMALELYAAIEDRKGRTERAGVFFRKAQIIRDAVDFRMPPITCLGDSFAKIDSTESRGKYENYNFAEIVEDALAELRENI